MEEEGREKYKWGSRGEKMSRRAKGSRSGKTRNE